MVLGPRPLASQPAASSSRLSASSVFSRPSLRSVTLPSIAASRPWPPRRLPARRCRSPKVLHLSLVGFALPLCLSHGYDLVCGAPTSRVIPPNDPAHQQIHQSRVMIDPILQVHVVAVILFFGDLEVQFEGMTEVVKDQGFALVHPVTLGYVCNPVPVELHVSPPSLCSLPTAHLTLTRPCP